jgi:hypothetical protein
MNWLKLILDFLRSNPEIVKDAGRKIEELILDEPPGVPLTYQAVEHNREQEKSSIAAGLVAHSGPPSKPPTKRPPAAPPRRRTK